jgi:hypothetical protein
MKIGRRLLQSDPAWTKRDRRFVRAAVVFLAIDLVTSLMSFAGTRATSAPGAFPMWLPPLLPVGFGLVGLYRALPYAPAPASPGSDAAAAAYRANPRPDVPPGPSPRGVPNVLFLYVWLHLVLLALAAFGLVLVGLVLWSCGRH